ncbi:hypothetical protein [Luteirhabdus pelagi]|uniref:hypothetical protein n=1 Tax=Luteirhabdus pelagi TaxID=2792783 RepID=UPI001939D1C1|nr:hypothetical protein [Luteirhabdus pelagi]
MKRILLSLLGMIFILSCKTLPNKGYENIQANPVKTHIDSLKVIPEAKLELNKFERLTLGKEDLSLFYFTEESSGKIDSFYEAAQIDIEKPGLYIATIESICSCIGFEKLIFVPMLEIRRKIDDKKVKTIPQGTELLEPSFTLSSRLKKTWLFDAEEEGSYLLLFYSDNTKLNSPLGQQSSFGYYGTLTYNVSTFKSNVSGGFRVKVERLE